MIAEKKHIAFLAALVEAVALAWYAWRKTRLLGSLSGRKSENELHSISDPIEFVKTDRQNELSYVRLMPITVKAKNELKKKFKAVSFDNYSHEIDSYGIKHSLKEHGNSFALRPNIRQNSRKVYPYRVSNQK